MNVKMKDIEFTVSDIKDLMNTFSKNKLSSMKLVQGEFSLELGGSGAGQTTAPASASAVGAESRAGAAGAETPEPCGNIVKAPIVGTFYAAPSPDSEPYVTAGAKVKKGDVLFIIESMKLMNEVTSDFNGTVGEIFVQNGAAVEYGQKILAIE